VRDVHNELIDSLAAGGNRQSGQRKKCRQKSDLERFHSSPFCRSSVVGITAARGDAPQASTSNRLNNHPQNVYISLDADGLWL
jgi:hypothetical protein